MAERFSCDPDEAQQLAENLFAVGARIASNESSGPSTANTGSGMLEPALSEFFTAVVSAGRALARDVDGSARSFSDLATGTDTLDQQEASATEGV